MKQFRKLTDLKDTANAGDALVEGYLLTLDNKEFRIVVFFEKTNDGKRGYILKIMYGDGKDEIVNLDDKEKYPKTNAIFDKYLYGLWINNGNKRFCYKYVVFGERDCDKVFAVTIMRHIVSDVLMSYTID